MSYKNYNNDLLTAAKDLTFLGEMQDANLTISLKNSTCQDSVTCFIKLDEKNTVSQIKFSVEGCILTRGSASLIAQFANGRSVLELKNTPLEVFKELINLQVGINRTECILLPINVLLSAIETL